MCGSRVLALLTLAFAAALCGCSSGACDEGCVGGVAIDGDVGANDVTVDLCVNGDCAVGHVLVGKCASTSSPTARFCLEANSGGTARLLVTVQEPNPHDGDHFTLSVNRYPDGVQLAHFDRTATYTKDGDCATCGTATMAL